MSEGVSEVEENNLRVLLATMRKHAPENLACIIFDVLLAGLAEDSTYVMLKDNDIGEPTDDPPVDSAVIVVQGKKSVAKFFKVLQAANLDEAEDTEIS